MKARFASILAAAAALLPAAYAQNAAPSAQSPTSSTEATAGTAAAAPPQLNTNVPVPKPPANLVKEPNASAFATNSGPEAERVKPIVDAMNADTSLEASKIVVVPDKDVITLVGVTVSDAQRKRAQEIAASQSGDAKIVNALTTQQLVVNMPTAAS